MYGVLSYPLDVIKTNRILDTPLAREAGQSLPKEFLALHERGALRNGLYRAYLPYLMMSPIAHKMYQHTQSGDSLTMALAIGAGTVMMNPFSVLIT